MQTGVGFDQIAYGDIHAQDLQNARQLIEAAAGHELTDDQVEAALAKKNRELSQSVLDSTLY